MIDWRSDDSHLLLNPRMPPRERKKLEALVEAVPPLPAHVWLATSGSTGSLKLTALSKRALLASAAAVNAHLDSTPGDIWACVLPTFHVGGLGIYARAFLTGARVVESSWAPDVFVVMCRAQSVTLASLVPAQVQDLVTAGIEAPLSVRAVVVGGGALPDALYDAAVELGWPLLPSYGMTECCSQIATARRGSRDLTLLTHVDARIEEDGRLAVRSPALLTGYALYVEDEARLVDPTVEGWFVTGDRARLDGRVLRVEGRVGEFVKIGGESVDLVRLDHILAEIAPDAAIAAVEDDRLGHVIHLYVASGDPQTVAEAFGARVMPYERARKVWRVPEIPRSPLGKLLRARLAEIAE